jgi:hypothetical protein
MADAPLCETRRWLRLTPGNLLVVLLAAEGFVALSQRFEWFAFNERRAHALLVAWATLGVFLLLMLLWFVASVLFHCRFQFSVLSLLVLMFAVAVPCSWLATEVKRAREEAKAVEAIRSSMGEIQYDWQADANGAALPNAQPPGPAWLRGLLGADLFASVTAVHPPERPPTSSAVLACLLGWAAGYRPPLWSDDSMLEHLEALPRLQRLDLGCGCGGTTDAGLKHLKGLARLQVLVLGGAKISDAGVNCLAGLAQLRFLDLRCTKISDAGLQRLGGLTQLQHVDLAGTKVTDVGLACIDGLTQLQYLNVAGTKVTDAGVGHLRALKQLRTLYLDYTRVTDAGLQRISGLSELRELWLDHTSITDAGVEHLKGLTQLRELRLNHTNVTDVGLKHLEGLPQLRFLDVNLTNVTCAGLTRFSRALPNCQLGLLFSDTFDPLDPYGDLGLKR